MSSDLVFGGFPRPMMEVLGQRGPSSPARSGEAQGGLREGCRAAADSQHLWDKVVPQHDVSAMGPQRLQCRRGAPGSGPTGALPSEHQPCRKFLVWLGVESQRQQETSLSCPASSALVEQSEGGALTLVLTRSTLGWDSRNTGSCPIQPSPFPPLLLVQLCVVAGLGFKS